MESLRRWIAQINEQAGLLNPSQKIAIALCVVILVGSLAWLLNWSATPQLTPLLAQDMSLNELDDAERALRGEGIDFDTRRNRIYVKPAEQANAIRILNRADALPQDTTIGFNTLIEESSPFLPESENAFRRRVALGNELAKVIASSPDVAAARVFIDAEGKRRFGRAKTRPTASVQVTMAKAKPIDQGMVEAFARLVAGAVRGLEPHHVNVIDAVTLRAYSVPNPKDVWAADMLDRKKKEEGHLLAKVLNQLAYVPGVLADVTVELDPAKTQTKSTTWARPELKSEETRTEKTSSGKDSGETGTNPNVGVALAGTGSATASKSEDTRTENFDPKPLETTVEEKLPFGIKRVTASVSIPRSFLVSIYKAQPGHDKDPVDTDEVFKAIKEAEQNKVRQIVKNTIMAQTDEDVEVSTYYDFQPGTATLREVPGGAPAHAGLDEAGSRTDWLGTYGPEAALSLLAVFSLLMVFMMVRKSTRAASSPSALRRPEPEDADLITGPDGMLTVSGAPVGRAESAEGVLQGQEVDEETLRFKELDEQVSKMVDDNPEVTADLLRRWVEGSD